MHQSICEQGATQYAGSEDMQGTVPKTTLAMGKSKVNLLLQTSCTFAYSVNEGFVPVRVLIDIKSMVICHQQFKYVQGWV